MLPPQFTDDQLLRMTTPHPSSKVYPRWVKVQITAIVQKEPGILQPDLIERLANESNTKYGKTTLRRYIADLEVEGKIRRSRNVDAKERDPYRLYLADHPDVSHLNAKKTSTSHSANTLRVYRVPLTELHNYIPKK